MITFRSKLKKLINNVLNLFDIGIEKKSKLTRIKNNELLIRDYGLLNHLDDLDMRLKYIENLNHSKSQLRQDLFVLNELNYKRNGFFVEFGATNGIDLSNTYLLENKFDWDGLLSEPAKVWHESLFNNRKCKIDKNCIWKKSGEKINFKEVSKPEFSTIDSFSNKDQNKYLRDNCQTYQVGSLSLMDFLEKYKAPLIIDYLSIDTEGSEYSILRNFDFKKYIFKVITVEHNFTDNREKIFQLLTNNGYCRKYEDLSIQDDWYVYTKNLFGNS